jgi:4a-hydroxytetrahydrobiopterin dehydratase
MSDTSLADERCVPCRGGAAPLPEADRNALLAQLGGGWEVEEGHHLAKRYPFSDFKAALGFTVQAGCLAEEVGHHPDLLLRWGSVSITVWTHDSDGLTRADFVLAAKLDQIANR